MSPGPSWKVMIATAGAQRTFHCAARSMPKATAQFAMKASCKDRPSGVRQDYYAVPTSSRPPTAKG